MSKELQKERLQEIANTEIMKLVAVSKKEQAAVESAKTSTKRKYHLRKLKKNNKELADMLVAVEKFKRRLDEETEENENVDS